MGASAFDTEPLLTIVYVSAAVDLFDEQQLRDLLGKAQEKNARLGITGLLLYRDGNFMQVLEGPESEVKKLYAEIEKDRRHRMVIPIVRESGLPREFSEWDMAFGRLSDSEWNDLMARIAPEGQSVSPLSAKGLLHSFWKAGF